MYGIDKNYIIANVYNNKFKTSDFSLDFGSFAYDISNDIITYDTNKSKNILVENGWKYSTDGWRKNFISRKL